MLTGRFWFSSYQKQEAFGENVRTRLNGLLTNILIPSVRMGVDFISCGLLLTDDTLNLKKHDMKSWAYQR